MSTLGATIHLKGELETIDDVTVEGRVEGSIWCEDGVVILTASAEVVGDIFAREITVFGRADGQLVATDVVDLREAASVKGRIVSPRFILWDGARFNGRAERQYLDAALRVARFHRRKRDATA